MNIWSNAVSFPHVTSSCHKGRSSYILVIMKYLVPPLHIPLRINTNLPCYTKTYATTQYQLSVQHVFSSPERTHNTVKMLFAAYLPVTKMDLSTHYQPTLQHVNQLRKRLRTRYQPTLQHVNRLQKRVSGRVTYISCKILTGYENVSQNALPTYLATC